ncbi:transmembrane protein 33 [Trichuris trichiura]|uniref:Transmembrane protein 33 n=1 Tax=Trichuris trichiura TaxID=36087 RepID=A0A077ZCE1_TRITR|nr:transmembrane protein 33 [Trichuris trichiura]
MLKPVVAGPRDFQIPELNEQGLRNPINSVLWFLRGVTIVCGLMFVFPLGLNKYSAYQKTLLSAAATNALRLHQRVGRIQFNMSFLQNTFCEDSFHYLLYCMILLSVQPMTLGLATVVLFALLHWCNFFVNLMQASHFGHTALCQATDTFIKKHMQTILHLAACCEIFLLPVIVSLTLYGKCNIIAPFIYYRFITMRYSSRRNPRTRLAFQELRATAEYVANHRACPSLLRKAIYQLIRLVNWLAPPPVH